MPHLSKYYLTILVALVAVSECMADSTFRQPINYAYRYNLGKVWPHNSNLKSIPMGPLHIHNALFLRQVSGKKEWHAAYKYPLCGVEFNFASLGNRQILGYSYGIAPHISFPLVSGRNQTFSISVSPGISYFDRVYNATTNPTNLAVGTSLNPFVQIGFFNEFGLTPDASVSLGINFIHASNGTVKKPNTGLNMISGFVQFRYGKRYPHSVALLAAASPEFSKNRVNISAFGAPKEIGKPGGKKYWLAATSFEYLRAVSPFTFFGLSTDIFYDSSSETVANRLGVNHNTQYELAKLGLAWVSEFRLDRLSLTLHLGAYAYNLTKEGKSIYQRVGLRYRVFGSTSLMLGLKGYMFTQEALAIADHLEIGCTFNLAKF